MNDHNPIRPTTIIEVPRLSRLLGVDTVLASEVFQHTGSFKFRAAYTVASNVPQGMLLTAFSGNFGQALAFACLLLKKSCIVVMPTTSARVKVDAVREFGGQVELVDVNVMSRAQRLNELAVEFPQAYVASPYDDPLAIEGNSSLGREICALEPNPDVVVVPVGGGGLISGIITGISRARNDIEVVGVEPLIANDAARSLRAGVLLSNSTEPATIADGARTLSLGKHNWEIIRHSVKTIIEVTEETIVEAVKALFTLANVKVEPTGGLSVAAVMSQPSLFRDRSVCCVLSGGNVDPATYVKILDGRL